MYLVTGGAGFIGSHIVQRLVSMGERVRVLDNFSFGKRKNLQGLKDKIELIDGDLMDPAVLRQATEGVEVVFHQAALRSVPLSVENPALVNRINVGGTINVLLTAWKMGVRRVVFASSSSVYGNRDTLPNHEAQTPNPMSPYAVSKLAGEHYCKVFTEIYGLETVSLRYFNVYGPRQDPNSQYAAVIPRFIRWARDGEPLQVYGDGLQSRDFTYIDDVVDANLRAAHGKEAVGRVFNVGQGISHSLMELIELIRRLLGKELEWRHLEARPGDVRQTLADLSLSELRLDYRPQVNFEMGIAQTIRAAIAQRPRWDAPRAMQRV